jgi:hypothetical protein
LVLDEPKAQDKVYTFAPLKMVIDDSLQGELAQRLQDHLRQAYRRRRRRLLGRLQFREVLLIFPESSVRGAGP